MNRRTKKIQKHKNSDFKVANEKKLLEEQKSHQA